MVDFHLYAAFVFAVTVLMLLPGPNVALIVASSLSHGRQYGLLTVAGTSLAMVPQLLLTIFGMSSFLMLVAEWVSWLRWLGVAYLVYLGVKAWRTKPADLARVQAQPKSRLRIFARGFLVSLSNPKTLLFYGAFFPQFVRVERDATSQLTLLALTFLALALVIDSAWALFAGSVRPLLVRHPVARQRTTGALLVSGALGLALSRRS
jgi:homoserine/homoserine lactone efflux protein